MSKLKGLVFEGLREMWWKLGDVWSWAESFAHKRATGCRRRWQGKTGTKEPEWGVRVGDKVQDGSVIWQCKGKGKA